MAEEYKGIELTSVYDDDFTTKPFDLQISGEQSPKYMSGADFERLGKINQKWKDPQFVVPSALEANKIRGADLTKPEEAVATYTGAIIDTIANFPDRRKNEVAQIIIEASDDRNKLAQRLTRFLSGIMPQLPFTDKQPVDLANDIINTSNVFRKDYSDEVVDALDGREYPIVSWARDTLANTTKAIQDREIARGLNAQQRGIDQDAWSNKFAEIAGNMTPIIALGGTTAGVAKAFGAAPATAGAVAKGVMEAGTAVDMSGQYAYETARRYLERTGDSDFSEFTANDAKGFSALGYGAIGSLIEFGFGGVEPLFAQAFSKAGVENGIMKAVGKTMAGEAWEEFLQEWEEFLFRTMDGTNDRTWGEALKDSVKAAIWGGLVGGATGGLVYRTNRRNIANILTNTGLDYKDALKVADQVLDDAHAEIQSNFNSAISAGEQAPQTVREKVREKVATMYEDIDLPEAEKQDIIDATTNLEVGALMTESAEKGYAPEESPLLQGVVNEIGYFREGIPEQVAEDVARLKDEVANLRTQLAEEQAKETKDYDKIDKLESKIEQFYNKLPQDIANLVETDRQRARQMLSAQMAELGSKQARRQAVRQVQERALRAMQKQDESELQKSLRRLQEETKSEEQKARAEERRQWQENRKLRKSVEKLRENVAKRRAKMPISQEVFADVDLVYQALRDSGYTDKQISKMKQDEMVKALAPYNITPLFQEEFNLADENARLDDIYPEYTGETIEVDGKERTVYNSNGDRIAKSKEALTNFWKWFGDSKVVDEQGRPLVVYHGSKTTFDIFDKSKVSSYSAFSKNFYFTDIKGRAKDYGDIVRAFYLKSNNIFDEELNLPTREDIEKINKILGKDGQKLSGDYGFDGLYMTGANFLNDLGVQTEQDYDYLLKEIGYDGIKSRDEYIVFEPTQIKSVDNRGTYSEKTGNIYRQSKNRGAYIPEYRFIARTQNMDASTLSHELAHDWMQQYFRWYRSGKASPEFMKSWGAVEKALGISPDDMRVPEKASEAFARAYEGWVLDKKDWAKDLDADDKEQEEIAKLMERYQTYLIDIYEDLTDPYFKETWGNVGELKPELKAWFDKVTLEEEPIKAQVESGKITSTEATAKVIAQNLNKVMQKSEEILTEKEKEEIQAVNRTNDTSRYEVEGGNKNSLQKRLSGLAQNIDANNIILGRYDTHRDMVEVARRADEFVRTRRDEAMDIINGIRPETEGLYASDLYTALERLAVENNDVDLAMELVNSEVATKLAKELGQRVAGFRNYKGDGDFDVISQVKTLDNKFKKDYDKKGKIQVEEAADEYVKELNKADAESDIDEFLKSIECQ